MFIWLAFMAAKNVSKVATTAFAPFEKFGKQMAGTIKYAPIPFTGGMSAASVEKIGSRLSELPQEANNKRLKESNIGKRLGMNGVTDDIGFKKINDRVSSNAEEAVRDNGHMAKENMQIAIQNGEKNIQSSDTIDKLMKAYKDIHGSELKIKDALNNNGMDAETATKMASKIYAGKTTSDSEVVKLWAEAAKK